MPQGDHRIGLLIFRHADSSEDSSAPHTSKAYARDYSLTANKRTKTGIVTGPLVFQAWIEKEMVTKAAKSSGAMYMILSENMILLNESV